MGRFELSRLKEYAEEGVCARERADDVALFVILNLGPPDLQPGAPKLELSWFN